MIKKLQPIQIDYVEQIMQMVRAVTLRMNSQGIYQWDEVYPDEETIINDLEKGFGYGYFEEDRLCAYLAVNEYCDSEYDAVDWEVREGEFLILHRLLVNPEQQGKGIAKKLLAFVEDYALQAGYATIRLDAFATNSSALALYEGRGYRRRGIVSFRKGFFYCYEKCLNA
ncbi:MAG: acetyltransferase [Bacteroidetes bacterium]|jgi:GNAT superfamily N-acetyltransferase|nr:acetyltransferase [Bacteroidota bacterium]